MVHILMQLQLLIFFFNITVCGSPHRIPSNGLKSSILSDQTLLVVYISEQMS